MAKKQQTDFIVGENAIIEYAKAMASPEVQVDIPRGKAVAFGNQRTFVGHDTNISVRSDYAKKDYDYFRPTKRIPTDLMGIIGMSMDSYYKVGIVRNIIDLMADFACQGIRFQHPRKSTENFYNKWFMDKVMGKKTSTQFLTMLLKAGNVVISRHNGFVPVVDENEWKKAISQDVELERIQFEKREIPLRYTFLNPLSLEYIGEDLANFVGKPTLAMKIPITVRNTINRASLITDPAKRAAINEMLKKIPKDMLRALQSGASVVPLDMNKISVSHYRKDDWMPWALPMTASILPDLVMLESMRLADISALDGAISNIRLWRLGVLDGPNSILPNTTVINKLRNILANNVGGGVLDLVWGPELDFKESNSQVYRFLGSEKYESTLNNIYETFGIPPTLRSGGGQTNTGNFIGLNTLVKRLQYIRDVLISFWKQEVTLVHKAMNFKGQIPRIIFDNMVLADEAAEKQLLLNMWDRDLISTESVQEIFGRVPEVESARIQTESESREEEEMPQKASPFHNPQTEHELNKIALQGGSVAPSEVGLELEDKKSGEKNKIEQTKDMQVAVNKAKPPMASPNTGTPGRPKNVTETNKRKPKPTERPSVRANPTLWAITAQDEISKLVTPALLAAYGKKNLRQLTKSQAETVEVIKYGILCTFEPFEEITAEKVYNSLNNNVKPDGKVYALYKQLIDEYVEMYMRELTLEEKRSAFAMAYAVVK